jgi:ABC-type proline/glycine betaine transport system substrate-binding protein
MKKIIIIAMICINIIAIQHTIHAQEEEDIGIGQVIFADKEAIIQEDSFLINELGYNIIKIHLSIAEKNIETINYE